MTGIPFILPRVRQLEEQALEVNDDVPIIPSRARNHALTLNEIGDAGVVANPKPSFRENVVGALRGIAATHPFDAQDEGFGESFLGSALNVFGGVTGEREGRRRERESEDEAIIAQETARRRQTRQDELTEALTGARIGAYDALAAERYAAALKTVVELDEEEETVDVEALAQAWEDAGRPEIAGFIRKNPDVVRRAPATFLRPSRAPTRFTPEEEAASERADRADLEAGREVMRRGDDPLTAVAPSAVDSVLGELRRLVDPTYAADSIVRDRVRGAGGAARPGRVEPPTTPEDELDIDQVLGLDPTGAVDTLTEAVRGYQTRTAGGATRVVPSRRNATVPERTTSGGRAPAQRPEPRLGGSVDNELQDVARQFDPRTLPISRAHGALTHATVQPPFSQEDLRTILDLAGYEDDDIDEILRDRSR